MNTINIIITILIIYEVLNWTTILYFYNKTNKQEYLMVMSLLSMIIPFIVFVCYLLTI